MPSQNIDLMPLVSSIIGGLIAVVPAYLIEKHRRKKERRIKGSYDVLIPLGKDLERIIEIIENVNPKLCNYFSGYEDIIKLNEYFSFDKRFFLDKKVATNLHYLIDFAKKNKSYLEFESLNFTNGYIKFLVDHLSMFYEGECINVIFFPTAREYFKKIVLEKNYNSLISWISAVEIAYADEKNKIIKCNSLERQEHIENEYVVTCEGSLFDDSYKLVEFFTKNIIPKEKDEIERLLSPTKSNEKKMKLLTTVKELKKIILDKVEVD